MPTKTTGAELKRFYKDDTFWPDDNGDTWHEDVKITVDGKELAESEYINDISDMSLVTIDGGIVFSKKWDEDKCPSFEAYFKRWKKQQDSVFILVEVPKSKLDAMTVALRAAGGKISE